MKAKKGIIGLVAVLVLGGSVYGYTRWQGQAQEATSKAISSVQVSTVSPATIERRVTATGVVVPTDDAQLFFGRAGRIKKLYVTEGQRVTKGTLIAELEADEEELDLLTAQRQYETAKIESPPNIIKERELALKIIQERLERTKLVAPFDGVVAELNFGVGEWVSTSNYLLTLVDDTTLFVKATIDEVDIARVQPGQRAVATFTALPGKMVQGQVKELAMLPKSQSDLVLFPVKVELAHKDPSLLIGLSSEVNIITQRREDVLVVPVEAVLDYEGKHLVSVVKADGSTEAVEVTTGLSDGNVVEITSGLSAGQQILSSNFELYRSLNGPAQHGPNMRINLPGMRR